MNNLIFFRYSTNLEHLDLSENRIQTLAADAFANLSCLEELDLSGNVLILKDLAGYVTRTKQPFDDLESLRNLHLQDNQINLLPPVFNNLNNLKFLNLSRNEIKGWNEPLFTANTSLYILDLSNNNIETLWKPMIYDIQGINITLIYNNDGFNCNCEVKKLEDPATEETKVRCSRPINGTEEASDFEDCDEQFASEHKTLNVFYILLIPTGVISLALVSYKR